MGKTDIQTVIVACAHAARRAREAGFDGFQVHGARGYLLNQSLAPYFNRRTGEYGGLIRNMARIILETLKTIRAQVGDAYPLSIKMHCSDFMDEAGFTLEGSLCVARELDSNGISGIELSGGHISAGWCANEFFDLIGISRPGGLIMNLLPNDAKRGVAVRDSGVAVDTTYTPGANEDSPPKSFKLQSYMMISLWR